MMKPLTIHEPGARAGYPSLAAELGMGVFGLPVSRAAGHEEPFFADADCRRVLLVGRAPVGWPGAEKQLRRRGFLVIQEPDERLPRTAENWRSYDAAVLCVGGAVEPHSVCGEARRLGYGGAILLISDGDDAIERILGLEIGADAWLATTADSRTIQAQLFATLRVRAAGHGQQSRQSADLLTVDELSLNENLRVAYVDKREVVLTRKQNSVLALLMRNAGRAVTRREVAEVLGHPESAAYSGRGPDTVISRIRRVLGETIASQIRTVRGEGYLLCSFSPGGRRPAVVRPAFAK